MAVPRCADDICVCEGKVIKHCHTLPQGLPEMGCCYSIVWQKRDGIVIPVVTRGLHKFMDESTKCTFQPNRGYVGRISEALDSIDHEVIPNVSFVDPRAFVRKTSAMLNGISSVLFVPQDGVLLELGFSKPNAGQDLLPCLRTSHALAIKQCLLADMPSGLFSFSRQDSPSTAGFRTRSPSPEHAQGKSWWPSIGSQGHPICCQFPCKYVRKRKGCKDGPDCRRCHLCQFSKSGAKNRFNLEYGLKAHAIATALSTIVVAAPVDLRATLIPQDEGCSDNSSVENI